jgi:hypothetical protein
MLVAYNVCTTKLAKVWEVITKPKPEWGFEAAPETFTFRPRCKPFCMCGQTTNYHNHSDDPSHICRWCGNEWPKRNVMKKRLTKWEITNHLENLRRIASP